MTITPDDFRQFFPEFGPADQYPDDIIQTYLDLAYQMLRPQAWHDNLDTGVKYFTAHNLVMFRREQMTLGAANAVPGSYGVLQSKTVGSVSASYDTKLGAMEGMADLNLSHYGVTFARLQNLMGQAVFVL